MEQYREASAKKASLVAGIDPMPEKPQEDLLYDPIQEVTVEEDPIVDDRLHELERLLPKSAEDQLDAARKIVSEAGTLVPKFTVDLFFTNPAMFIALREKIQAKLTGAEAMLTIVLAKADSDYARIPFFRRWMFYVLALFGRIHESTINSLMGRNARRKALHAAVEELRELLSHLRANATSTEHSVKKQNEDLARATAQKFLVHNARYKELVWESQWLQSDMEVLEAVNPQLQWAVVKDLHKKLLKQDAPKFLDEYEKNRVGRALKKVVETRLDDINKRMTEMERVAIQAAKDGDPGVGLS